MLIQITHAINRYVRLGFDIQTGKDIENAIKNIRGTSVAQLVPNRDRGIYNYKIRIMYFYICVNCNIMCKINYFFIIIHIIKPSFYCKIINYNQ